MTDPLAELTALVADAPCLHPDFGVLGCPTFPGVHPECAIAAIVAAPPELRAALVGLEQVHVHWGDEEVVVYSDDYPDGRAINGVDNDHNCPPLYRIANEAARA